MEENIDPLGQRCPTHARGGWAGNRGIIDVGNHKHAWGPRAWFTSALDYFPDERSDARCTHLLFDDEASAIAAGHRPCARCRGADYSKYGDARAGPRSPAERQGSR